MGYSEGIGTDSCISNFTINDEMLDLEDHVAELNSVMGCDQVSVLKVS